MTPSEKSVIKLLALVSTIILSVFICLVIYPYLLSQQSPNPHQYYPEDNRKDDVEPLMNITYGGIGSSGGGGYVWKPCENLSPGASAYFDTWLIQCMEIEPLPTDPTFTPTPEPTPPPSLAREISNVTIDLPISGNLTLVLYQNQAGGTCVESISYFPEQFLVINHGRQFEELYCTNGIGYSTPNDIITVYNNRVKWYSPGGVIYEGQLKEKNRRITEEEFARSKPKWDIDCRDDTCTLTNIYNQSQLRYKVRNVTTIRGTTT